MPQDLSNIKEIITICNMAQFVNKKLASGDWVLIEFKIVEIWSWREKNGVPGYLEKTYQTLHTIGRIK